MGEDLPPVSLPLYGNISKLRCLGAQADSGTGVDLQLL